MKTVKAHLETLPEPYRSKALANLTGRFDNLEIEKQFSALIYAFSWERSKEGFRFWQELYLKLSHIDMLVEKLNTIDTRRYTSKQVVDELKRWAKEL